MMPRKNVTHIVDKYFSKDCKTEYYLDTNKIVAVTEIGFVFELFTNTWRYDAIMNEIQLENFTKDLKNILE